MLRRLVAAIILALALAAPVTLEMPATAAPAHEGSTFSPVIQGSAPAWTLPPVRGNGIDYWPAKGLYYGKGAVGGQAPANTRATNEWCFTSTGTLVQAGPYQNCVTDLGVEAQEGRTNGIKNNSFSGAALGVVGSGGALPTGWSCSCIGLTANVTALGVVGGMPNITINISGTTTGQYFILHFGAYSDVSAVYGQTWSSSSWESLAGSNISNVVASGLWLQDTGSGGAGLASTVQGTAPGTLTNSVINNTIVPSGTLYEYPGFYMNFSAASGQTFNGNITFAVPQLERNAIPASVASAVTGGANGSGGSGYLINDTGTITATNGGTAATYKVTGVSGTTVTTVSITAAGSYTVDATHGLPASPAATVATSGVGTGLTLTPTPTNNAAQAFATTPILTTNGALARSPDSITLPVAACSGSGSLYAIGIPAAPTGYLQYQSLAQIDDGTSNNRLDFSRAPNGYIVANSTVGGVGVNVTASAAPVAAGVSGKTSLFSTASTLKTVYNNGTINSGAVTGFPAGMTTLRIGIANGGQAPFNGTISRVAVACGQSLLLSEAPANNNDMFAANDNVPWLKAVGVF